MHCRRFSSPTAYKVVQMSSTLNTSSRYNREHFTALWARLEYLHTFTKGGFESRIWSFYFRIWILQIIEMKALFRNSSTTTTVVPLSKARPTVWHRETPSDQSWHVLSLINTWKSNCTFTFTTRDSSSLITLHCFVYSFMVHSTYQFQQSNDMTEPM